MVIERWSTRRCGGRGGDRRSDHRRQDPHRRSTLPFVVSAGEPHWGRDAVTSSRDVDIDLVDFEARPHPDHHRFPHLAHSGAGEGGQHTQPRIGATWPGISSIWPTVGQIPLTADRRRRAGLRARPAGRGVGAVVGHPHPRGGPGPAPVPRRRRDPARRSGCGHRDPVGARRGCPRRSPLEQVSALLDGVQGDDPVSRRDAALLEVLYGTGARISEVVGLSIGDVDLHDGLVRLMGKGSKERIVPLGRMAADRARALVRRPAADRKWCRPVGLGAATPKRCSSTSAAVD